MHHKLMQAMAAREARYVLEGKIQVNDAYLGGERIGGKVGRGSEKEGAYCCRRAADRGGSSVARTLDAGACFQADSDLGTGARSSGAG